MSLSLFLATTTPQTLCRRWRASLPRSGFRCACQRTSSMQFSSSSSSSQPVQEIQVISPPKDQEPLAHSIQPFFEKQIPVVMRGAVSHVPAIEFWKSWEYWQQTVGNETCKVEIGGSYGSQDMDSTEIPMEGYLQYLQLFEKRHASTPFQSIPKEELVYLAQNDLFARLYQDVWIPDFCDDNNDSSTTQTKVGLGRLYSCMLWLGPRGCVSPLHYDPLDNCLMQYVGRKSILLYPPNATDQLYAGHDGQQSNTSPIDPTAPAGARSRERYPIFYSQRPTAYECSLEPGDLLYIPSKWWHFVQCLETAASVNVWWR